MRKREHNRSQALLAFLQVNIESMPTWIWIFWCPQLLVMLYKDPETLQHKVGKHILYKLCKLYPQTSYYSLRARYYYKNRDVQGSVLEDLLKILKTRNPHVLQVIENIGKEFFENVKHTQEEDLHNLLSRLLNFNQLL